ncbi:MAG: hypothetical protein P4L16_06210 [Chlamydiales bacterium]|nr:hypothetical protein [Chlamydiales bacterium]
MIGAATHVQHLATHIVRLFAILAQHHAQHLAIHAHNHAILAAINQQTCWISIQELPFEGSSCNVIN